MMLAIAPLTQDVELVQIMLYLVVIPYAINASFLVLVLQILSEGCRCSESKAGCAQ
jgi:hypothetical protein